MLARELAVDGGAAAEPQGSANWRPGDPRPNRRSVVTGVQLHDADARGTSELAVSLGAMVQRLPCSGVQGVNAGIPRPDAVSNTAIPPAPRCCCHLYDRCPEDVGQGSKGWQPAQRFGNVYRCSASARSTTPRVESVTAVGSCDRWRV